MARYTSGMTATIAGTANRPIFAVLNAAAVSGLVREIAIYNTTTTGCVYKVVKFTGGTAGTGQTEGKHRHRAPAASCAAVAGYTADVTTIDEDTGIRAAVPGSIGAGVILTFGDNGLEHDVGTTKGIGLIPVGTGQVCEVAFTWDE
jgi:hypothetical protein